MQEAGHKTMKRLLTALLALALLGVQAALAVELPDLNEYTDSELAELSAALDAELAERGEDAGGASEEAEASEAADVKPLKEGSAGAAVKELQLRLIELDYLSGSADGAYGALTRAAVERFQREAGLEVSGMADAETQQALFAEEAPAAKQPMELDFTAISRDPDKYEGKEYCFSGSVLQVIEEEEGDAVEVELRVATSGNYDDVVYVTYRRRKGESRILEEDRVTVEGIYSGLYTYETLIGGTITLPRFNATSLTLS